MTMKEIATPPSGEVVVKTLEFSESARTSDQVQIAVTVSLPFGIAHCKSIKPCMIYICVLWPVMQCNLESALIN